LTELSTGLTKAGLDPSKIQKRAEMIAKVRGVERKRKRDEEESAMDVDDQDGNDDEEWMDVDGKEDATPSKRRKSNTGRSVTAKGHKPRTNRQMDGFRDESQASKAVKLRNLGQRERNMHAKAGESDRAIRVKMPKHLYSGKRKGGKTQRR